MRVKHRAAQKPAAKPAGRWRFTPWNGVFIILGMVLAFTLSQLGVFNSKAKPVRNQSGSSSSAENTKPWGRLEVTPIVLERPAEYFAGDPPHMPKLNWIFKDMDAPKLAEFFKHVGAQDHVLSQLLDTNHWRFTPMGVAMEPPLNLVRDLSPFTRERIYRVLGEHEANVMVRYPFIYRRDGFEEWFGQSGLAPETIAAIRRMTFVRGDRLCFSDAHYFRLTLPTNEMQRLARALSRVPTLLVTLRVSEQSDINKLLDYWGSPQRNRNLKPLLESMARVPGGAGLNVSYLFPPLAQSLLYTYPNPTNRFLPKQPDCFWSAMNFPHPTADPRYLDSQYIQQVLEAEYRRVPEATQFGDVILLYEPGEMWHTVHMCVYIAEDIVYTKNGSDPYQPWVLMRQKDMMINYPSEKPLQFAVYRRNQRF